MTLFYIYIFIYLYTFFFFNILFHYGLSQEIGYSSMHYTAGPCCLPTLSVVLIVCIYQSQIPSASLSLPLSLLSNYKSDLYVCDSVSALHIGSLVSYFRYHNLSGVMWYLSFSFRLTSRSMILSSCIHVAADGIKSFFFMAE